MAMFFCQVSPGSQVAAPPLHRHASSQHFGLSPARRPDGHEEEICEAPGAQGGDVPGGRRRRFPGHQHDRRAADAKDHGCRRKTGSERRSRNARFQGCQCTSHAEGSSTSLSGS